MSGMYDVLGRGTRLVEPSWERAGSQTTLVVGSKEDHPPRASERVFINLKMVLPLSGGMRGVTVGFATMTFCAGRRGPGKRRNDSKTEVAVGGTP